MADQGKRTKESAGEQIPGSQVVQKIGGAFQIQQSPQYIKERIELYNSIIEKQRLCYSNAQKRPIKITLKDGKQLEGIAFETTPLQIAKKISNKLEKSAIVAQVYYTNKDKFELDAGLINTGPEEEEDVKQQTPQNQIQKNFELHDLTRPLEGDCEINILDFEDPLGKQVFWHSSAHILGETLELDYGCSLCIGPPLQKGFYYDAYIGQHKITEHDFERLEKIAYQQIHQNQQFERIVLSKEEALKMFAYNPFKVQLIKNKVPENGKTTAYRCGDLIDLCTGPHVPSTNRVEAFALIKTSGAYWLGKQGNDDLQRVYGISFPNQKQLKEYQRIREELEKRDHRNVGSKYQLFNFHQLAPGSPFFFPHGAKIYNRLINVMRHEYLMRGFTEVISPNLYDVKLWEISGHLAKYSNNLFQLKNDENEIYGIKPMNCPGHCLMFDMDIKSYRDLPIRFADFGVLHRKECSGALTGLIRLYRFQQDDAHIFCRPDQIFQEIWNNLLFLEYVYSLFDMKFKLELSTRPEKKLGSEELWDQAESALEDALKKYGQPYRINAGDGAFYGPKIDVKLFDCFEREHQCGTIQCDFNLPIRFNLQYKTSELESQENKEKEQQKDDIETDQQQKEKQTTKGKKEKKEKNKGKKEGKGQQSEQQSEQQQQTQGEEELKKIQAQKEEQEQLAKKKQEEELAKQKQLEEEKKQSENLTEEQKDAKYYQQKLKNGFERPVIIHRAILGSVERMLAILCESTNGRWPFWLSPRQIIICPISEKFRQYGSAICNRLKLEGFNAELDVSDSSINKKVRNAQLMQFNYIGCVGHDEEVAGFVDLRDAFAGKDHERLGKLTIEQLIVFLKSKDKLASKAEKDMWASAYTKLSELEELNKDLRDKMFLEGEGFSCGAKDKEMFEKLQNQKIDKDVLPNLFRWFSFMQHQK